MKTRNILVGSLLVLSLVMALSCKKEKKEEPKEPTPAPTLADYEQYLVSNYYFNNTLTDSSISNVNLINNGGAAFAYDRDSNSNSAINFDGTNDYLEFTSSNHIKLTFPFTVSMWVYLNQNGTYSNRLLNSDAALGNYYGYNIVCGIAGGTSSPGIISAGYGNGTGSNSNARKTVYSSTAISAQEWHHIVAVFKSATEIMLYIDGVKETTTTDGAATSIVYSSSPARIGNLGTYYLGGSVDNLKIWNKALPASLISEEYQSNL